MLPKTPTPHDLLPALVHRQKKDVFTRIIQQRRIEPTESRQLPQHPRARTRHALLGNDQEALQDAPEVAMKARAVLSRWHSTGQSSTTLMRG
jgi:hypothetical protein